MDAVPLVCEVPHAHFAVVEGGLAAVGAHDDAAGVRLEGIRVPCLLQRPRDGARVLLPEPAE